MRSATGLRAAHEQFVSSRRTAPDVARWSRPRGRDRPPAARVPTAARCRLSACTPASWGSTATSTRWHRCCRCSASCSPRTPGTTTTSSRSPTSTAPCLGRGVARGAGRRRADELRRGRGMDRERGRHERARHRTGRREARAEIFGPEHYNTVVQPWSCSAAPIRDPDGRLLGAVDITGGENLATPRALALVRATARAVEAELARRAAAADGRAMPSVRRRAGRPGGYPRRPARRERTRAARGGRCRARATWPGSPRTRAIRWCCPTAGWSAPNPGRRRRASLGVLRRTERRAAGPYTVAAHGPRAGLRRAGDRGAHAPAEPTAQ